MSWSLRRPAHPNIYWPDQWEVVLSNDGFPTHIGTVTNQATPPETDNWKPYDEQYRPIGDPYRQLRDAAAEAVYARWKRDHG